MEFTGMAIPSRSMVFPWKEYSVRLAPGIAGGKVHSASGAILIVQIATSAEARAAHEFGGGAGAVVEPILPATTKTSVDRPLSSRTVCRGIFWSQNMEK